jgi:flagellar protein FlaG
MIDMNSRLVPQQLLGVNASLTDGRKLPEAAVAGNKSQEDALPEVQGGRNTAPAEKLTGAISQLNGYLEETHRGLRFSIDDDSGRTIVRVIDTETDDVIRQIPSEEMLALIRHFNEITGSIFDEVA